MPLVPSDINASKANAIDPSSKPGKVEGVAGSSDCRGGGGGGSQLDFERGGGVGRFTASGVATGEATCEDDDGGGTGTCAARDATDDDGAGIGARLSCDDDDDGGGTGARLSCDDDDDADGSATAAIARALGG